MLEALIEQMRQEAEPIILPIINDPDLPALDKLHRFFDTAARWKTARKDYISFAGARWYADENAIVRQKIQTSQIKWATPLLDKIIRQGVREGVFNTAFPDQIGELVLSLLYHIGRCHGGVDLLERRQRRSNWLTCRKDWWPLITTRWSAMLGAPRFVESDGY